MEIKRTSFVKGFMGAMVFSALVGGGFAVLDQLGSGPREYSRRMNERYANYEKVNPSSGATTYEQAHRKALELSELAKRAYEESNCSFN